MCDFDCDGTLIDSERLCIQAIVEVLESVGVNVDYEKVKDQFQGVKLEKIFGELIADSSLLSDDSLTGLVRHYRQRCQELFTEQLTVIDGVYEVLDELKATTLPYALRQMPLTKRWRLPYR
ncbi:putative phosphatase YieH [Vibrio variabilis]|uniref:Phosphatase YieH n=1 Tax=Vibrio variabilis TaxID=990271 RepID=A0ABQ0J5H6_9VIBR|nr:putative phosphatase YieH [Vibrio variabilis]